MIHAVWFHYRVMKFFNIFEYKLGIIQLIHINNCRIKNTSWRLTWKCIKISDSCFVILLSGTSDLRWNSRTRWIWLFRFIKASFNKNSLNKLFLLILLISNISVRYCAKTADTRWSARQQVGIRQEDQESDTRASGRPCGKSCGILQQCSLWRNICRWGVLER